MVSKARNATGRASRVTAIDAARVDDLFEKVLYNEVTGETIERRNHAVKTARTAKNPIRDDGADITRCEKPMQIARRGNIGREFRSNTFASEPGRHDRATPHRPADSAHGQNTAAYGMMKACEPINHPWASQSAARGRCLAK